MKINKKLVGYFSDAIGYIDILLELDGFDDVKETYQNIRLVLLSWVKDYYINKNFNNITYDESLKIHDQLQEIRDFKIFDNSLGMEAMITDSILIAYESVVKMINDELS